MPRKRKSQKAKLIFDEKQKEQLKTLSQSRKAPVREAQRANILLRYSEDIPITESVDEYHWLHILFMRVYG